MKIEQTINNTSGIFRLEGWLDNNTAKLLADASAGLDAGVRELELDLEKLEYISSSGVRQIVALHKKMDKLILTNVSADIRDVFHMTGLDKRLNIL